MINNSVSGYKNEGAKNITNVNPTSGGGSGTFNAISNIGTGDSILINNDPTITAKTLLAGAGISLVDTGSEIQIINSISPGAESYGYYKTDTARYVSVSHPNADQPGTNVFTTLQLAFDDIIASGQPTDTNFNIMIEKTAGMESPNISCAYNINLWMLGDHILGTLTYDLQNNNTLNITAPNGILTCDSIINNSSSSTPILRLTNVNVTTEITDNSANGQLYIEGCILGKFTAKQLKHCNNMILTSNLSLATSADNITNSEFYESLDIATFSDPYSGFKNCYFKGVAKNFNGASLQLDSNSLYSFNANSWTNASGITTILETVDGVSSVSGSGGTTGLTLTGGPITSTGTLTLGGILNGANGGTGNSSYTIGDILYANTTSTLTKLPASAAGTFLRSAGAGVAPAWSSTTIPATVSTNRILVTGAGNSIVTSNAPTNGQFLIGTSGSGFSLGTLTAGTNISVTNGAGSITVASPAVAKIVSTSGTATGSLANGTSTHNASYTIPANTFASNVDSLEFYYTFEYSINSGTPTILYEFGPNSGSSPIALVNLGSSSTAGSGFLRVFMVRTNTTQISMRFELLIANTSMNYTSSNLVTYTGGFASASASPLGLKFSNTSGGASSAQITMYGSRVTSYIQ